MFSSTGVQPTLPDNFIFEQVDPSVDDEDSDSETYNQVNSNQHGFMQTGLISGLKPGKKTKGRVKIKMEFIENKLRRYTTFSKRKTGIMKKAYELSTLTGTQVMLLVASETGHVYTFATRKLQPIITSESGKALIQTCLNSPDPPPGTPSGNVLEQRMNPSGFEETDLSCAVGEEEQLMKPGETTLKPVFPGPVPINPVFDQSASSRTVRDGAPSTLPANEIEASATHNTAKKDSITESTLASAQTKLLTLTNSMLQSLKSSVAETSNSNATNNVNSVTSIAPGTSIMQLPMILPQGFHIQPTTQSLSQPVAVSVSQASQGQGSVKASLSQVVTALHSQHAMSSSQNNQTGELNTPLPASTPSAINIMQGMTPGIVMYHTPQGVVYATPTQNLQDRTIFNFQQPATAISMTQAEQPSGQQIITIPVPVSISGTPVLQLAPPPSVESPKMNPPPLKKVKK
ncbi:serum response factor [Plakobranchus ocellatus]|uniref:Serum response factor n=1 Tax=Plakobranchus ocellatus TaxID=259542 RepID=A0AAV3ZR82_9GAST|nr:serum response factor [Plakobranchus ocellatus]